MHPAVRDPRIVPAAGSRLSRAAFLPLIRIALVAMRRALRGAALGAALLGTVACAAVQTDGSAVSDADAAARAAWDGFQRGDPQAAQQALAESPHGLLAPWFAYWALQPDLQRMTQAQFERFARDYPDTYVLARMRDAWLLELGQRQDWKDFAAVYPQQSAGADRQVECYELQRRFEVDGVDTSAGVLELWNEPGGAGVGCNAAVHTLAQAGRIDQAQIWRRLQDFFRDGRIALARPFAPDLPIGAWQGIDRAAREPMSLVLSALRHGVPRNTMHRQFLVLALLRLGEQDPQQTMQLVDGSLGRLPARERALVAYHAARSAALQWLPDASRWFKQAASMDRDAPVDPTTLDWMLRAALRAQDWATVDDVAQRLIRRDGMRPEWVYWQATAQRQLGHDDVARALYSDVASPWNFYGQLATEALGLKIELPPSAAPPSAQAVAAQRARPEVRRALALYALRIYPPAQQQWSFALRGLDDDSLHAAAQLACEQHAWMLCIDASERMRDKVDWNQRYAMPYRDAIAAASRSSGVSEALLFGLIRQESRFAADIKSWAGAHGLMQLMPQTASWVARKIGLDGYSPADIGHARTNVALGSAYLGMLLRRFDGSQAMAAAGYNAGPGRPARWRDKDPLQLGGAVFTENIPISETRGYVERVLANATIYAARLSGQPQSLQSRLGLAAPDVAAAQPPMP
ncbi:soluble lytic murein transglycosylase precursor [mine drainage metagenome]|uniref:Soluble lytic murein transglycosylase n=1 Tax=mine drainage metagenome TaxID=410659 RepID=A0A1J5PYA3_9ZZZZ